MVNDPAAAARTRAGFEADARRRLVVDPGPVTGSEDVGLLATAAGAPCVYWLLGGADPAAFAGAQSLEDVAEVVRGLPSNHAPDFAPVIDADAAHRGAALVSAARTWLPVALTATRGQRRELPPQVGDRLGAPVQHRQQHPLVRRVDAVGGQARAEEHQRRAELLGEVGLRSAAALPEEEHLGRRRRPRPARWREQRGHRRGVEVAGAGRDAGRPGRAPRRWMPVGQPVGDPGA